MKRFPKLQICLCIFISFLLIISGNILPLASQISTLKLDTIYLDIKCFDARDGLTAGYTTKIIQDSLENIWIGSLAGLNKYNGYCFKTYTNDPFKKYSLPNDIVEPLFTDGYNRIWFVSGDSKGFIYLNKKEVFLPLLFPTKVSTFRDENGFIWSFRQNEWIIAHEDDFYLSNDTFRIDPSKVKSFGHRFDLPDLIKENFLKNNFSVIDSSLIFVAENFLYSFKIDYSSLKITLNFKTELPVNPFNSKGRIGNLIVDKEANLIHVFTSDQYFNYSLKAGTMNFKLQYPKGISLLKPYIIDKKNNIWITDDRNLYRFNPNKSKIEEIRTMDKVSVNFGRNKGVRKVSKDKLGNIYFCTTGTGFYMYNISLERFNYIGDQHDGPGMLLYQLKGGNVYVEYGQKLYKIDKYNNKLKLFFNGKKTPDVTRIGFFEDDKGNQFIILKENNYTIYKINDNQNPIFISDKRVKDYTKYWAYRYLFHFKDSILNLNLNNKYEKNGSISSLLLFTKMHASRRGEITTDTLMINKPGIFYGESLKGKNGDVWLATSNTGLIKYNIYTKKSKIYELNIKQNSIPSNALNGLLFDPVTPDSVLWIGTTKGLSKFNFITEKFTNFNTENGLPNNVIYCIMADKRNNLWLSSNKGLSLFNRTTNEIINYDFSDGLQHNEFNKSGSAKDQDGVLYFSGMGGLTYFDPEDFYKKSPDSKLNIYGIKVLNQEINYDANIAAANQYLTKPIEFTEDITFTNEDKMITIQFALMDMSSPQKNKYRYKLSGLSNDWIELGSKNEVTFINLAPGNYTLTVQGANHNGVWSKYTDSINFEVLGPWWKKTWFYFLLISIVIFIIIFLFKLREKNKQALHMLRNKISSNLHDDIGSTLSSISLFGTVAQKNMEEQNSLPYKMLEKINQSSTLVMESMNDIVWAINAENDKMLNVFQRIRAYLSDFENVSDIVIETQFESSIANINLNMIQRRNVYLIFKEAVNNAVKYAKASKIVINIQEIDKNIELYISDDGVGFEQTEINQKNTISGNGLRNMQIRAKELKGNLTIHSNPGEGTTIKLSFYPKLNQ